MGESEAKLSEKVEDHQEELLAIYAKVFRALERIDRSQCKPEQRLQLGEADLEPPEEIEPAKAIAILKATVGSTDEDMIQLERLYPVSMEGSSSVGSFFEEEMSALGIGYHDLYLFLRERGWLKSS
jgi:hypothetical protein